MNTFFRICVAVYSFISMILCAVVMISPFGEKRLLALILDYLEINIYQSNDYDVIVFIVGFVFLIISVALLTSGISGKRSAKYITRNNDNGQVYISSAAIENISLAMAKKFQGVKDAKAKAEFHDNHISIVMRLQVFAGANMPELGASIQDRIKETVENSTNIKVDEVNVSFDGASVSE